MGVVGDLVAEEFGEILEFGGVARIGFDEVVVGLEHEVGGVVFVKTFTGFGDVGVGKQLKIGVGGQ